MEVLTVQNIKDTLAMILPEEPVNKAILFGSYAKGLALPNSDIDLVIDSNSILKGLNFFGVLEKIKEAFG